MSWDIELVVAEAWTRCVCADCGHVHQRLSRPVLHETQHTSNTWTMMRAAGIEWSDLSGKSGAEVEPELSRAIKDMEARPKHYRLLNPPNGWGSYETHLALLRDLRDACAAHPAAVLRVS